MSKVSFLQFNFEEDRVFDFVTLFKTAILSIFAVFFFLELNLFKGVYSDSLYAKKVILFLVSFASFFVLYNFKNKKTWRTLLFALCLFDLAFLTVYSFYNQIPINLFVGFLSLNTIVAGLFLSVYESLFLVAGVVFSFLIFLINRSLLNLPYSAFYFGLNTMSFLLYAGAAIFLQKFFVGSRSQLNYLNRKLLSQEELNDAVLKSVEVAVLTGDLDQVKALNKKGEEFLKAFAQPFTNFLSLEGKETAAHFEVEKSQFRVSESLLKTSSNSKEKVWLVSDETEVLRVQRELEQSRKLSAIGQLSAGLAHEIRNPLAGISGSIELIKEGALDIKDSKKLFDTVLREIERLNLLVTDFLGFARPEVNCDTEIEVDQFFEDMISLVKLDPRSKGLSLIHI